jgi:hypothetical protein
MLSMYRCRRTEVSLWANDALAYISLRWPVYASLINPLLNSGWRGHVLFEATFQRGIGSLSPSCMLTGVLCMHAPTGSKVERSSLGAKEMLNTKEIS